jgi:hypothetical protein
MSDMTTIQVSAATRSRIEERKVGDESYDQALQRILGDGEQLLWSEREIRDLARSEAEAAIEDATHR